jgi:hypothetical protein
MVSCAPVGNRRLWPVYKAVPGGLPTRRRLPTCPTTSAEFPFVGKLSGIGRQIVYRTGRGAPALGGIAASIFLRWSYQVNFRTSEVATTIAKAMPALLNRRITI